MKDNFGKNDSKPTDVNLDPIYNSILTMNPLPQFMGFGIRVLLSILIKHTNYLTATILYSVSYVILVIAASRLADDMQLIGTSRILHDMSSDSLPIKQTGNFK